MRQLNEQFGIAKAGLVVGATLTTRVWNTTTSLIRSLRCCTPRLTTLAERVPMGQLSGEMPDFAIRRLSTNYIFHKPTLFTSVTTS